MTILQWKFEFNAYKKTKILTASETDGRDSSTADGKSSSSGIYKCYVFYIYGNSVIQCVKYCPRYLRSLTWKSD